MHSHPQRVLSIKSHLIPVQATCLIRADPMSAVVRRNSLLQFSKTECRFTRKTKTGRPTCGQMPLLKSEISGHRGTRPETLHAV